MIVCEAKKLLYLAPPKTGSASVVRLLTQPEFGGYNYDTKINHHNTVWEKRFQNWYIFITVRHPYTKAVSFWRYACAQALTRKNPENPRSWCNAFPDGLPNLEGFLFFPRMQYAFNTAWRTSWHMEQLPRPVDKVVYQEFFDADMAQVVPLRGHKLIRENDGPASRCHWHTFYTKEAISQVQELWGADFEAFGYNPNFEECMAGKFFTEKSPHYQKAIV